MNDTATLKLRIDSIEAELASQRLKGLTRSGAQAERATDGLMKTMKRFAGPAAILAGAVASLRKVVSVTREFNVLNAQLITATGSAQKAGVAFEAIQDFAADTPYDLQQVTDGFNKLVNLGLTPSERALTSYGDTASSMGKSLNQLVEAVADAATGEFERLKEFGIRASSQGDQVAFTFRGVTTTVKKNAAEIEEYLIGLGENNFAGAMAERMATLDGALSNLNDEWNKLFLNISNQGVGSVIEGAVRDAIDILGELNDMLASGQMEAYLDAIGGKFDGFGKDVAITLDLITEVWNDFLGSSEGQGIAGATVETLKFILDAFKNLPENVRAVVQLMVTEFAAFVDYGKAYGQAFAQILGIEFAKLVEKSKAYGTAIGQAINPFDDDDFDLEKRLAELDSLAGTMSDEAINRAKKQAEATSNARRQSIEEILKERETALGSFDAQIAKADELRKKYEEERAARKAGQGDRLEQFKTGSTEGPTAQESKDFGKLVEDLRTEEEIIKESYDRRLDLILKNTEEESVKRADLKKKLDEQFATDALGDLAAPDTFEEQVAELEDFYQRRRELILGNVNLTEADRTALEEELTKQRNERLKALEMERTSQILSNSSDLFGNLADLSKQFAGEQSTAYKVMFAASKAFALAESVIKIQQGIAAASSLPWPTNLGAISSTVAATSSVISTISGTNYSGAYDNGGLIPSGKFGLVGEVGPELVEGPARVRSRKDTAAMLREGQASGPAPAPVVNLKNINVLDPSVVGDYLATDDGEELVMNIVQRNQKALGF